MVIRCSADYPRNISAISIQDAKNTIGPFALKFFFKTDFDFDRHPSHISRYMIFQLIIYKSKMKPLNKEAPVWHKMYDMQPEGQGSKPVINNVLYTEDQTLNLL